MDMLFLQLKELEMNAHKWHLETTSYAQHNAFGMLYENINGILDSIMEELQGQKGERVSVDGATIKFYPIDSHMELIDKTYNLLRIQSDIHSKDIENTIITGMEFLLKIKYLLTLN